MTVYLVDAMRKIRATSVRISANSYVYGRSASKIAYISLK